MIPVDRTTVIVPKTVGDDASENLKKEKKVTRNRDAVIKTPDGIGEGGRDHGRNLHDEVIESEDLALGNAKHEDRLILTAIEGNNMQYKDREP